MFKLDIRGSDEIHIDLDEDTGKAKCEKNPLGFPVNKADGSEACLLVYKGKGERLDKDVVLENISEGKVTFRDKNSGETKEYEI